MPNEKKKIYRPDIQKPDVYHPDFNESIDPPAMPEISGPTPDTQNEPPTQSESDTE